MRLLVWIIIIAVLDLLLISRVGVRLGGGRLLIYLAAAALVGYLAIRTRGFRFAARRPDEPRSGTGLLDGALIVAAGLLLAYPGPVSDVVGLLLLVPGVRSRIAEEARRALGRRFGVGRMDGGPSGGSWGWPGSPPGGAGPRPPPHGGQGKDYPGSERARDVEFEPAKPDPGPSRR